MREKFGKQKLKEQIQKLGSKIEKPVKAYLIGGGAMAFRDLKDATKDIDIVIIEGRDFKILQEGLKKIGYLKVRDLGQEYKELGAHLMMEGRSGLRFDIFKEKVADKLMFSKAMEERSTELIKADSLTIEMTSPEDIFLFKSVAGRPTDIDDMNVLVQSGLDFETIEKEIGNQIELLNEKLFVTYINEALIALEKDYGVRTPLTRRVRDITEQVYNELEVLQLIDEKTKLKKLRGEIEFEEGQLDDVLESLEERNVIEVSDDGVIKKTDKEGGKP